MADTMTLARETSMDFPAWQYFRGMVGYQLNCSRCRGILDAHAAVQIDRLETGVSEVMCLGCWRRVSRMIRVADRERYDVIYGPAFEPNGLIIDGVSPWPVPARSPRKARPYILKLAKPDGTAPVCVTVSDRWGGPGLVVHREAGPDGEVEGRCRWAITHRESGMRAGYYPSLADAVSLAAWLEERYDWTKPADVVGREVVKRPEIMAMIQLMRA